MSFVPRTTEAVLREHLINMLEHFNRDKAKTARAMGITCKTLHAWLWKWDLFETYKYEKQ